MKNEGRGGSGGASAVNPTNFGKLSEGCVSYILTHTSPRDACRASSISRDFQRFANSDAVWERFLPSDYQDIISRSVSPVVYSSKKELYLRLCDSPILLDNGSKSFSLDKQNGKKCIMLAASALWIVWHDTLLYWRWTYWPGSRFSKVAELLAVCWFHVEGQIMTRMLTSETTYAAYLVHKIGEISYGLDCKGKTVLRHFGRDGNVLKNMFSKAVYLKPPKPGGSLHILGNGESMGATPQTRVDGWMEIELGRFFNSDMDGKVNFWFCETQELDWKSGLIVQGIDIRPIDA